MTLPLAGVRVLDLSNVLAGPFCAYQLALLGADVIKVEHPEGGDLARRLGADKGASMRNMGASFVAVNAGKQSITLNLKDPRGKAILRELVKTADVLVENFRPGVMTRLGLDFDALREVNPKLVYCAISGFGKDGEFSKRPAYDQIIQGISGVMSVTGDAESAPLRVGYPVSDTVGGLTAAFGICAALVDARASGQRPHARCLDAGIHAVDHGLGRIELSERRRHARADGQRKLHRRAFGHLQDRRRAAQYRREREQAVREPLPSDRPRRSARRRALFRAQRAQGESRSIESRNRSGIGKRTAR